MNSPVHVKTYLKSRTFAYFPMNTSLLRGSDSLCTIIVENCEQETIALHTKSTYRCESVGPHHRRSRTGFHGFVLSRNLYTVNIFDVRVVNSTIVCECPCYRGADLQTVAGGHIGYVGRCLGLGGRGRMRKGPGWGLELSGAPLLKRFYLINVLYQHTYLSIMSMHSSFLPR